MIRGVFLCISNHYQSLESVRFKRTASSLPELRTRPTSHQSIIVGSSFVVVDRNARTGRNPQTGKAISIPASRQPKFKPGKGLKDAVNG
ncbi:MAG TPA: hypothetical protein HPP84_06880 [Rhodospirillaceae bacterium]|nr:hypothetical protein [Rhodospirillaceae bacterium]